VDLFIVQKQEECTTWSWLDAHSALEWGKWDFLHRHQSW